MPQTCKCGSITITCSKGCGCFCVGEIDCTQWCEPVQVETAFDARTIREGGVVRTLKNADGTDRLYINAMATGPEGGLPRHARGTRLKGCTKGAGLESVALVLGELHGAKVTVPPGRAKETVNEPLSGTLEEIAEKFGLTVTY